jgi:hypothetical protein
MMHGKNVLRWMLVLLIAVAALGTALPATFAQDDGDGGDEADTASCDGITSLTGFVLFDEDDLTVAGIIVAPSGVFNPSELDDGDLVMVEGYCLNETTFKATGFTMIEEADDECADDEVGDDDGDEVGDDDDGEVGDDDCDDVGDEGDDGDDVGDDDGDDVGDDDDDAGDAACAEDHPVLTNLAEEFGVDYDMLAELHCDGNGVGNIAKLLLIAEAAEVDFDVVLEMYLDGMNVNQIAREFDVKITGVGHVSNGRPRGDDDDDGDDDDAGAPGRSGDAPGHSGDDDGAPGNSGNAPGHTGDNPGHGGDNPGHGGGKKK